MAEEAHTLPWTDMRENPVWSAVFHAGEGRLAAARVAATAAANTLLAEVDAPYDDAAELAEMESYPEGSRQHRRIEERRSWREWLAAAKDSSGRAVVRIEIWKLEFQRILFARVLGGIIARIDASVHIRRWCDVEVALGYLSATAPDAWGEEQYSSLLSMLAPYLILRSNFKNNLLRLAFDHLTLAQINGFGQWLIENGARRWRVEELQLRPILSKMDWLWLKLRAYVADYLWRAQVERADLARHIDSHHGAHARAVLDHIIAPMLDQPRMQGMPVSAHPRPSSHRFPPPRTSQELRNALTGIDSEFGGINRGQPKRNASDDEEEEEEERAGPHAAAAAAASRPQAPPHKYHKQQ